MLNLKSIKTMGSIKDLNGDKAFLDNSIDENSYFIGMGDVFTVSVVEMPSITYTAKVNQNGDVRITEFGILKLGKITLRQAKDSIGNFVRRKLSKKNTSVYVTLHEAKKASFSINGSVTNPGIYISGGIYRIWDCILQANKDVIPTINDVDFRNVVVQNKDTTFTLDLLRYYLKNDLTQNPYVYPGDHVFLAPAVRRVFIQGEIRNPTSGFIPIKNNESLRDFLELLVLSDAADSGRIIIQKGSTNSKRRDRVISMHEADGIALDNNDVITVPLKADYPKIRIVYLSGAVARPGPYTCGEKTTTVQDIIVRCGGYLSKADPERAYIIRNSNSNIDLPGENTAAMMSDKGPLLSAGSIRPELNLSFSRLTTFQDYTVISLEEQGLETVLEHADQIIVPYEEPFVYVSGSVCNPGAYRFNKGKNQRYYINLAGGFSGKADRRNTYLVSRYQTSLKIKDGNNIEEGDIIVVPDSQNNKFWISFILPMLQILSTATTVILAVATLSANR